MNFKSASDVLNHEWCNQAISFLHKHTTGIKPFEWTAVHQSGRDANQVFLCKMFL